MPNYTSQIQDPNLSGLSGTSAPVNKSNAGTAGLVAALGGLAANAYGRYAAKKAGTELGGEDTYEAAGQVADQAANELQGLTEEKAAAQGHDVTIEQAKDLRDQVFGRVLTNQKRIDSAVRRGLMSSTEATARLSVLRNEALSNPLVAPYQHELDNAMYKTTGGSGTTFAATAEEQAAAAKKKGELAALEESQKQVSTLIHLGIANSEKQALNYIAQMDAQKRKMAYIDEKKATLGLNSQEVYAANQAFQTQQASSAFATIAKWQSSGGDANQKQQLQLKLVQDGELTKQAIRARAFDKNGQLIVQAEQLASQLAEVDKRTKDFTSMLDDQSGTKKLTDVIAQYTAAMDLKSTEVNVDLAKRLPIVYALKNQPVAQKWYLDTITGTNKLKNEWIASENPVMKVIASLPEAELADKVSKAGDDFVNGGDLDSEGRAITATTLLGKGGTAAADLAYKNHPEQTLKTLSETPFTIKGIAASSEWKNANFQSPEVVDQVAAIIEGAASRALVSTAYQQHRRGDGAANKRYAAPDAFVVPASVKVTPIPGGGTVSTNDRKLGRGYGHWMIDTGGVPVNDDYKSEVTNAYRLGTEQPAIWQDDFKSVDEWINHLFARPVNK